MRLNKTTVSAASGKPLTRHVQPGLSLFSLAFCFLIQAYRLVISPAQVYLFGAQGGCRFTPTCSQYAIDAIREHGVLDGTLLAARRICRCHPFGECGHDPVPKAVTLSKTEKHLRPC